MKLHYFPTANSLKVLAVAHYLGIDLELERVDLLKGEQLTPEFLKLNPNHMTPTLQDDGFVLWESNAIIQYLCDTRSGVNTLWPSDPQVRADISRWQCWQLAHWGPPCQTLAFERLIKSRFGWGGPDAVAVEKAEQDFHTFAAVLDQHLLGRDWIVGRDVTLADFSVAAPLIFSEAARFPLQSYAEIRRWYAGVDSLGAWSKALSYRDLKSDAD